ncbi:uncharacterized protein LOC141527075 isoform X2 [Cotesia typhae]|uniref:uncharacterized protein LOC141527075 isoform X2 n=1 Tax=Cotesia typhae TaxID=2053667 RepID=UPI003D6984CA
MPGASANNHSALDWNLRIHSRVTWRCIQELARADQRLYPRMSRAIADVNRIFFTIRKCPNTTPIKSGTQNSNFERSIIEVTFWNTLILILTNQSTKLFLQRAYERINLPATKTGRIHYSYGSISRQLMIHK